MRDRERDGFVASLLTHVVDPLTLTLDADWLRREADVAIEVILLSWLTW
jgi:hypothetical protein